MTLAHDEAEVPARPWALFLGILVAVAAYFAGAWLTYPADVDPFRARRGLAVTMLVATYWLTGAMPLGAASLLPLVLFPALAIQPMSLVANSYADPILWMFFGGFVLARAIERFDLHRRLALHVIAGIGVRPRRLVLGFIVAATVLSAWINNTATALMLMPIGVALVDRIAKDGVLAPQHARRFSVGVMLGIAYGCSIGGLASPIGTPTNLVFFADSNYGAMVKAGAPELSFATWMAVFAPMSAVLALALWLMLTRWLHPLPRLASEGAADAIRSELRALGKMSRAERRVLLLFLATVTLWITRGNMGGVPGWESLVGLPRNHVTDGTVAVGMALLAFVIPSGQPARPTLMDWRTAASIPWDMYFLLAGGFAIAQSLDGTGLSRALSESLAPVMQGLDPLFALAVLIVFTTILSEIASNTAIASLLMPVLRATAGAAGLDPRALMLPAVLGSSFGFAMPIATPPNAVVFATGRVSLREMVRAGLALDVVCCAVLVGWCYLVVFPWLGISFDQVPAWAK